MEPGREGGAVRVPVKLVSLGEEVNFLPKKKQVLLLDEAISSTETYAFPYKLDSTKAATDGLSYYSCGLSESDHVFCCVELPSRTASNKAYEAYKRVEAVKWQTTQCENTEHQGRPVTCCMFAQ